VVNFTFQPLYPLGYPLRKISGIAREPGQNHDIKIANTCFENVAEFACLGTTITNQNLIQEEIKRRLNSGNACYHSVQNILSSRLLSRSIKLEHNKTII
jgi:hypothetical protein